MGNIIGKRYRLEKQLGEGGTGRVWLAEDMRLKRKWAVKEMRTDTPEDYKNRNTSRELEVLKDKKHKGLPFIADYIREGEACYLVQEYIEGISMEEYLKSERSIDAVKAVEWMLELTEILEYLHGLRPPVYHLDLKPSNIMICPDGRLMLIDFGAAGTGYAGEDYGLLGTYGYAAPEQHPGKMGKGSPDARSDIYALGAVFYRMVSGEDPAAPPYGVAKQGIKALPDPLIRRIIGRCVKERKQERYQTVSELRCELARYRKRMGICRLIGLRRPAVRLEKAVFYTSKKRIGLLLLSLLLLLAFPVRTLYAGAASAPLTVAVAGQAGRKLLIKEESRLRFQGDLGLVIPEEYFKEGEQIQVEVKLVSAGRPVRKGTVFVQKEKGGL